VIGVVGVGEVGAACAYASMMRGVADRYILYDIDYDKANAHGMDIAHGRAFAPPCEIETVRELDGLAACDIIVITAGTKQQPGQSRMELAGANIRLMDELMPKLLAVAPNAIYLLVSNPVDVSTMVAHEHVIKNGGDGRRVIGSGTVLDTARLRHELAARLGVNATNIHAYIVGEHGETELPLWSSATVGGTPLHQFKPKGKRPLTVQERSSILECVRGAAQQIIQGKGATSQAIGLCTARICEAVLHDERAVLPISSYHESLNDLNIEPVCFSVPTIVGSAGVIRVIDELPLNDAERAGLEQSAAGIVRGYRESRDTLTA